MIKEVGQMADSIDALSITLRHLNGGLCVAQTILAELLSSSQIRRELGLPILEERPDPDHPLKFPSI